jgi:hypothetical protein
MTSDLSDVQELRLFNLKMLHGTVAEHIAPTSNQLVGALKAGGFEGPALSDLYLRKKAITENLAQQIEIALDVPVGWLSRDHRLWLNASAEDLDLVQRLLSLPAEARYHLAAFLQRCDTGN